MLMMVLKEQIPEELAPCRFLAAMVTRVFTSSNLIIHGVAGVVFASCGTTIRVRSQRHSLPSAGQSRQRINADRCRRS